ncbi:MAG: VTT domain-containing protein [Christensenellaceae bacterium]|jgi:uncharacterized membrane protein YdjX (TVP38/TMEM64 family)|nr:VTT domain-containing protein [Christensenellaceae bacterium]
MNESSANRAGKKRALLTALSLLGLAALCVLYFYLDSKGCLSVFKSAEALQAYVRGFGAWGPAVFMLLQFLQVIAAPIPGNVTTLAGGALFGFWPSLLFSSAAIFAGSLAAFGLGRRFGRPLIERLAPPAVVDKYLPLIAQKQRMTLTLLFLFPFFPDDLLCLLAGLGGYSWGYFALMCALTRPWGLVFSALVGSGALSLPPWGWGVLVALSALLFFASARYGEKIEAFLLGLIRKRETP